MWVPRDTPQEIVNKLNAAVVETLADPTVKQRMTDVGQDIFPREHQSASALAAKQRAEIDKWWPIIRAAGIKAQ
jgi:tripartite-type tricarboxylate transporter receptor subunit TctC